VVALSASGETDEILQLLATVKRLGVPLITMTCDDLHSLPEGPRSMSTLAQAADIALDCSVAHEACSLGLAPTASTTSMLALGDALAVALSQRRGFKKRTSPICIPEANSANDFCASLPLCARETPCPKSNPRQP